MGSSFQWYVGVGAGQCSRIFGGCGGILSWRCQDLN